MVKIKRSITVTIDRYELVKLLVAAIYPKAEDSTGKDHTFYVALAHLIGRTDVEAVEMANRNAENLKQPRIEVDEFRLWLPEILAEVFGEFVRYRDGITDATESSAKGDK